MFLGASLGTVTSAVVWTWTAVAGSPCIGVDVSGAGVTGGGMVFCTGDATLGVIGTSATSSFLGRFPD